MQRKQVWIFVGVLMLIALFGVIIAPKPMDLGFIALIFFGIIRLWSYERKRPQETKTEK